MVTLTHPIKGGWWIRNSTSCFSVWDVREFKFPTISMITCPVRCDDMNVSSLRDQGTPCPVTYHPVGLVALPWPRRSNGNSSCSEVPNQRVSLVKVPSPTIFLEQSRGMHITVRGTRKLISRMLISLPGNKPCLPRSGPLTHSLYRVFGGLPIYPSWTNPFTYTRPVKWLVAVCGSRRH